MSGITREQFLQASKPEVEFVPDVPGLDGGIHVRVMSGLEYGALQDATLDPKTGRIRTFKLYQAWVVVYTACDESGRRLFQDGDVGAVAQKSFRTLSAIYEAAARLNGLTDKDVEEIAGNSETGPISFCSTA